MAKARKRNNEATLKHFTRPSFPGYPGYPGMPGHPGIPGAPGNMSISLATAYVPPQVFNGSSMYPPADALHNGTLFPELYRPYP
jgi:hypothetical protein